MSTSGGSVFPDRRWGREHSRLRDVAVWFSCTRLGSTVIRRLTAVDRKVLERTSGRFTILGPIAAPVLLLTTTGARSGRERTTPLLFGRDDGDTLIVVGSNFGQAHHPAWTTNLMAHPQAIVRIAGKAIPVSAQLLTGEEAALAYQKMVDVARTYEEYQSRTSRSIRVFRLRATPSEHGLV